eukprot:jgi/Mesen1/4992/ME000248S04267
MADHGNVITITSKEEWDKQLSEAANSSKAIIVDFSAVWCGPCKIIAPVFVDLSKKHNNLVFLKVDVDEVQEVAEICKISAMPTFQVFKDGVKVDELVGASREKLEAIVAKYA